MFCRSISGSYAAPRDRGGADREAAIQNALRAVALGASLHAASVQHDAPYSSLHKAWKAMQGAVWDEYVKTVPSPQPPPKAAADPAASQWPLKPRLERKAVRSGDAVPYGQQARPAAGEAALQLRVRALQGAAGGTASVKNLASWGWCTHSQGWRGHRRQGCITAAP